MSCYRINRKRWIEMPIFILIFSILSRTRKSR